jgi:hypothetical protein
MCSFAGDCDNATSFLVKVPALSSYNFARKEARIVPNYIIKINYKLL